MVCRQICKIEDNMQYKIGMLKPPNAQRPPIFFYRWSNEMEMDILYQF